MNDLIETHFDEYSNESAITAWETMKFKIKSACIAFIKNKKNKKKQKTKKNALTQINLTDTTS